MPSERNADILMFSDEARQRARPLWRRNPELIGFAAPKGERIEESLVPRENRRALVAGLNPRELQICRDLLENAGFAVNAVKSEVAVTVAARELAPRVILVGAELYRAAGRKAMERLRTFPALRSTPVIVLDATTAKDAVTVSILPNPRREFLTSGLIHRALRRAIE
jgi:CheY-like chemotaxis protein